MTIENLIKAVPPPAQPYEAFSGPWEPVEAELGAVLPGDYKEFSRLYGSGIFMEFLSINTPRSENPHARIEYQARLFHHFHSNHEDFIYAIWPNRGGVILIADTYNGDSIFWIPTGPAETWKILVWGRGYGSFEVFDCDLTDFLAGLATGRLAPREFPDDMLPCDEFFRPYTGSPAQDDSRSNREADEDGERSGPGTSD